MKRGINNKNTLGQPCSDLTYEAKNQLTSIIQRNTRFTIRSFSIGFESSFGSFRSESRWESTETGSRSADGGGSEVRDWESSGGGG